MYRHEEVYVRSDERRVGGCRINGAPRGRQDHRPDLGSLTAATANLNSHSISRRSSVRGVVRPEEGVCDVYGRVSRCSFLYVSEPNGQDVGALAFVRPWLVFRLSGSDGAFAGRGLTARRGDQMRRKDARCVDGARCKAALRRGLGLSYMQQSSAAGRCRGKVRR